MILLVDVRNTSLLFMTFYKLGMRLSVSFLGEVGAVLLDEALFWQRLESKIKQLANDTTGTQRPVGI
jgi:hypothetical protein